MRKWVMTMIFSTSADFEVEAETYNEAVEKAYEQARDFPIDVKELERELGNYEELPGDYELADGYYDDPDEEEEFEPGRMHVAIMGLNPQQFPSGKLNETFT